MDLPSEERQPQEELVYKLFALFALCKNNCRSHSMFCLNLALKKMKRKISKSAPSEDVSSIGKDTALESLNKKMKSDLETDTKPVWIPNDDTLYHHEESQISIDSIGSIGSIGSVNFDEETFISVKEDLPFISSEMNTDESFDHVNTKPAEIVNKMDRIEHVVDFYGLPPVCATLFKQYKGVTRLYDWQEKLLSLPELRAGKNLVYSLPTSGGKTLISEIIMIRTCQLLRKKALFVLPYVSICEEKSLDLQLLSDELNFFVEAYFGTKGRVPLDPGNQLIVSTIEKANLVIDSLIEENRIHELGCIVVDELHMLGEGDRGQLLEQMLSKILFIQRERKTAIVPNTDPSFSQQEEQKIENISIQIIGMSATIPNLEQIASWLDATIYKSDFRPVPLSEFYCIGDAVFDKEGTQVRTLTPFPTEKGTGRPDPDFITSLCCEVIPSDSVLVFCPTKQSCEDCVKHLSQTLPISDYLTEEKKELVENLKLLGNNDANLLNGVLYGVAYHHSSLTTEERSLIEMAYRNHVLCVICCTSTLAAGINLPAKRVIFNTPYIGYKQFLTKSKYLQMSGRAGRAGIDKYGESFLGKFAVFETFQINAMRHQFYKSKTRPKLMVERISSTSLWKISTAASTRTTWIPSVGSAWKLFQVSSFPIRRILKSL